MIKKFILFAMFLTILFPENACANDVKIWRDTSLDFSQIKKIIVVPVTAQLKAGRGLKPIQQIAKDLEQYVIGGIKQVKQSKNIIVKTMDEVMREEIMMYGRTASSLEEFIMHASEMGYEAFINVNLTQEFAQEHIKETTINYTSYQNAYINNNRGFVVGTVQIPQNQSVTIPGYDLVYLYTFCTPTLFLTKDLLQDINNAGYRAIVNYQRYKRYRGGSVMKVAENVIKASMKSLITGKKR